MFQASFKNETLVLIFNDDSDEDLIITLYYKHENDGSFQKVDLRNKCAGGKANEYQVEYIIPDVKTGKYTCKIQSKCDFGMSEMSNEKSVLKESKVNTFIA